MPIWKVREINRSDNNDEEEEEEEEKEAAEEEHSGEVGRQLQTTLSQFGQTEAVVRRLKSLSMTKMKKTKK